MPQCDKYVLCEVNSHDPNEQLGLAGFKAGITKFSSMAAAWFIGSETGTPFWTLFGVINDPYECKVSFWIGTYLADERNWICFFSFFLSHSNVIRSIVLNSMKAKLKWPPNTYTVNFENANKFKKSELCNQFGFYFYFEFKWENLQEFCINGFYASFS